MAKATQSKAVTLELSQQEAEVLVSIMGNFVGSEYRSVTNEIYGALREADVESTITFNSSFNLDK